MRLSLTEQGTTSGSIWDLQLWLEAVVHVLTIRTANESDDVTYSLEILHASAVDLMEKQRAP